MRRWLTRTEAIAEARVLWKDFNGERAQLSRWSSAPCDPDQLHEPQQLRALVGETEFGAPIYLWDNGHVMWMGAIWHRFTNVADEDK